MKVNLGIWDKLTRMVIFLLFIAGVLLVALGILILANRMSWLMRLLPSPSLQGG